MAKVEKECQKIRKYAHSVECSQKYRENGKSLKGMLYLLIDRKESGVVWEYFPCTVALFFCQKKLICLKLRCVNLVRPFQGNPIKANWGKDEKISKKRHIRKGSLHLLRTNKLGKFTSKINSKNFENPYEHHKFCMFTF